MVIHNDNKQSILCNKFAYDQNVYYFTLRWFGFDQRFKKKVVQTNCLLSFNAKSSIEVKILFLGSLNLGKLKSILCLVQVNMKRSVF